MTDSRKILGKETHTDAEEVCPKFAIKECLFLPGSWPLDHRPWQHCTRFVCLSLGYLSVAFMGSCIGRLGSLNYRPNYISACSENHARFLASPSCPCRSVPPSQFSLKGTELTLESVESKKPGSIRTSPALLAFSLSAGIPLFPAGREVVNDRIVCCRKETSHVQPVPSSKPLRLSWRLGASTPWSARLGVFWCSPLWRRNCPRKSQMTQDAVLPSPLSQKT